MALGIPLINFNPLSISCLGPKASEFVTSMKNRLNSLTLCPESARSEFFEQLLGGLLRKL